jgi:uncharacterized protein (TIGR00369 family)
MSERERRTGVAWEDETDGPHVWRTLGYRRVDPSGEQPVIEWDAGEEYTFPDGSGGSIVHGGLVATLLDTAMGHACWNLLDEGQSFLTADLRVEFFRSARPGTLRAEGRVVHRTRRVVFCAAELLDTDGKLIAGARCTQILRTD